MYGGGFAAPGELEFVNRALSLIGIGLEHFDVGLPGGGNGRVLRNQHELVAQAYSKTTSTQSKTLADNLFIDEKLRSILPAVKRGPPGFAGPCRGC